MKKILLATTRLAASTGFAAAEVALSGDARMGLILGSDGDARFTSRARVRFTMSGTTDGGLEFGASFRADQAPAAFSVDEDCVDALPAAPDPEDILACTSTGGGATGGTNMTAGSVYISGAFGKLEMGDLDNAANTLVGNVSGVGMTGLGDQNELGYLGQDDTGIRYTYTAGAISFALSAGQIESEDYSVAVKYATDAYSVALGYENEGSSDEDQLSLGGSATFGAATVKAVINDWSEDEDLAYAVSVDYTTGAATITAFYADHHGEYNAYGLGAAYDLGGGAKVVGGVMKREGVDIVADLGVSMSF